MVAMPAQNIKRTSKNIFRLPPSPDILITFVCFFPEGIMPDFICKTFNREKTF